MHPRPTVSARPQGGGSLQNLHGLQQSGTWNSLAIGGFVVEYLVHNNKETRERRITEVHTCAHLGSVPKRCPCEKSRLSAPSCSVVEGVTEDDTIHDNADISVAHDSTAPPDRLRASTSGWNAVVIRDPRFHFGGATPQEFVTVD